MNEQENKQIKYDIPIYDMPDFDYSGFQVVRGEFFAHIAEPSISFCNNKVNVNTACIKKVLETDYVQILVNPDDKILAVRPCDEDMKDSIRWCSATSKRSPKQITCKIFFAKVMDLMNWDGANRYKLLGKLIKTKDELLFIFDLSTPEIFLRQGEDEETSKISKKPTYIESWKDQFGVPFKEHINSVQIEKFNEVTVFGITQSEIRQRNKKEKQEVV